jgi:multidrug efflux pump subunit AcrB
VPIVALTLWSHNPALGGHELGQIARAIESELKRVPNTRNVYTIGDTKPMVRVELDPGRLSAAGLTAGDLAAALQAASLVRQADAVVERNRLSPVQAGQYLANRDDVGGLIVSARDGKSIYLDDRIDVLDAGDLAEHLLHRACDEIFDLLGARAGEWDQNIGERNLNLRLFFARCHEDGKRLTVSQMPWDATIYHKDLLPVVFVTGDMAGRLDSPLYGMFSIVSQINKAPPGGQPVLRRFVSPPDRLSDFSLKWDGEWTITYETFRDIGLAYAVGLVFIYLLVVAQFRSYAVPLVIMAPIPLTIIGVMPGHALLGANFTATSMIGMIALAGIIVRNSILLVDFINQEIAAGQPPAQAVIRAASIRARPIVLTGLAAMIGAFFIIDDPIFNGLAISLIFGILVSTALTLLLIPLLYYGYIRRSHEGAVH